MMPNGPLFTSIPQTLWSARLARPFIHCAACSVPLLEAETYSVQKTFDSGRTVHEMAFCHHCVGRVQRQYSEESRTKLMGHFSEVLKRNSPELKDLIVSMSEEPGKLQPEVEEQAPLTMDSLLKALSRAAADLCRDALEKFCLRHCLACRRPIDDLRRYSIMATCTSDKIVLHSSDESQTALLMCESCSEDVQPLISARTRGEWDRFMEEEVGGPPGTEADSPEFSPVAF